MPSSGDLYPPPASASGGLENTLYHRKRKNVKLSVVRMVMSRKWIAEIMEFRTLQIKWFQHQLKGSSAFCLKRTTISWCNLLVNNVVYYKIYGSMRGQGKLEVLVLNFVSLKKNWRKSVYIYIYIYHEYQSNKIPRKGLESEWSLDVKIIKKQNTLLFTSIRSLFISRQEMVGRSPHKLRWS